MENFADRYERVLVPVIFRPWAQEMIRRAPPRDGDHILDLACGTGAVTREIISSGILPASLTGVDHNPDILEVARQRASEVGIEADWIHASAEALPFDDDRFDRVYCQQAFQFFPDRPAALKELRRVLKPGAEAAFCVQRDISLNPLLKAQAAALEKNVGAEAGAAVRAICGLPDGDEIHDLFIDAGFGNVRVESVTLTLHHPDGRAFAEGAMGGMHTGDKLSQSTQSNRERTVSDFLDGLEGCFDGTAIRFPHVSNVVTATA